MGHHRARDGDEPDDLTVEQVRSTLRDAADGYRPDRAAMADRVATGRAGTTPPGGAGRTRFRMPAAAALAVAFLLIAGISVARLSSGPDRTVGADRPPASVPAVAGSPSAPAPAGPVPAGSVPAGSAPAGSGRSVPAGPTGPAPSRTPPGPPRGPSATAPGTTGAAPNGFLTAAGAPDRNSGPTWSQDNVTITVRRPVVELTVTVTVALTPGVTEHGRYTTAPNADVTMTVTRTATSLVYSFVLDPGRTLVPGDYLFAAQFTHEPGRDGADAYTVAARTADGRAELSGAVAG